jgi:hypothetical protein
VDVLIVTWHAGGGSQMALGLFGPELPVAVAAELDRGPADVVVVDCLLPAVACLVESRPEASVLLFHLLHGFHGATAGDGSGPWVWRTLLEVVNAIRVGDGLAPLPLGPESVNVALARAAAGALVGLPREPDTWDDPPPGVVHVGPLPEEAPGEPFASPWPADDRRPLVVVSLGTQPCTRRTSSRASRARLQRSTPGCSC